MSAALILLALLLQADPAKLIERLGSDQVEERDRATAALKTLGEKALPELRKAAKERRGEHAARARDIIGWIEVQTLLTPTLKELFPELEKELLEGKPRAWYGVFYTLKEYDDPDYEALAPRERALIYEGALRDAENYEEFSEVLEEMTFLPAPVSAALIIPILSAENPGLREKAAFAAGACGLADAVPALRKAMRDPEETVRHRAIEALGQLRDRQVVSDLLVLLEKGGPVDATVAATALGRIGSAEAEKLLRMRAKELGFLGNAAIHALADLKVEDAPALLASILMNGDFADQRKAMERLVSYGEKALPAVRPVLGRANPEGRRFAVEALARSRIPEAIPDVAAALRDPDGKVRATAAEMLRSLRRKDQTKAIAALLADTDWSARLEAAQALGVFGAKEYIPELRTLLKDSAPFTRFAAANALCVLGDEAGAALLIREAEDRRMLVKQVISLTSLNALRMPETWRRLTSREVDLPLQGPPRDVLQKLCDAGGLKLDFGDDDSEDDSADFPWRQRRLKVGNWGHRPSLWSAIDGMAGAFDFILEADTLRVVPHSEAIRLWKEWEAKRPKK